MATSTPNVGPWYDGINIGPWQQTPVATATPVISLTSGTYPSGTTITITCDTPGAVIYFTVDGTDPTESSSVYTSPLNIFTGTLKTVAKSPDLLISEIASEVYIVSGVIVGVELQTSDGVWAFHPESYTYQWTRDNIDITGETGTTYTTQASDIGAEIRCEVTATNDVGSTEATSDSIEVFASP